MNFDVEAAYKKIYELVASNASVSDSMQQMIRLCELNFPHGDWDALAKIDYDADVASLSGWIPDVLWKYPDPFPEFKGLFFGLCNPLREYGTQLDMYLAYMQEYNSHKIEYDWLFVADTPYPPNAFANSKSLQQIWDVAYGTPNGLNNKASRPLCLAFAAFAARSLLENLNPSEISRRSTQIGVVVGFDTGDILTIGELTDNGFEAASP
ncbi:hypothetical protein [Planctomicrobium piriforme]|uniref:Uncharacterized protein n=1 Tax=Planctomicrobium piriforme TaxID=1576369 RepID=A0A1I3HQK8_9PLAN|nr:hypothetical protein [Planctomicrobium piriforme]SFI37847.1 hypothetical protein SAMN05421753_108151 [Planctomicrobium piriforme]